MTWFIHAITLLLVHMILFSPIHICMYLAETRSNWLSFASYFFVGLVRRYCLPALEQTRSIFFLSVCLMLQADWHTPFSTFDPFFFFLSFFLSSFFPFFSLIPQLYKFRSLISFHISSAFSLVALPPQKPLLGLKYISWNCDFLSFLPQ